MGVSAVPGSGKTQTLSYLAAKLIRERIEEEEEEVLIVTLVNSAVENFSARVSAFIQSYGLLPHTGYRVRTLHGLSHDIVRERPSLVGLSDDFYIIDDRTTEQILKDCVQTWIRGNPYALLDFLTPDCNDEKISWLRRDKFPDVITEIARAFIKEAKDLQMTVTDIRNRLDRYSEKFPLIEMGLAIYEDYNRALSYRGGVDFDDLICLALKALKLDEAYLCRLRKRWPYILEDEAQDSSLLQEEILRLLSGHEGNWVRVGDPNQAIYETFTTANPKYLRNFLNEPEVTPRELPNSGRSTKSIINLANYLIRWTQNSHPVENLRNALVPPYIEQTDPDDPQPNPTDNLSKIKILLKKFTPGEEREFIINSLRKWLPQNQHSTVAVLMFKNDPASELVDELKKNKIDYVELLRSTKSTRDTAGALAHVLGYLAYPAYPAQLARLYEVWRRKDRDEEEIKNEIHRIASLLKNCQYVEDFLWPRMSKNWLEDMGLREEEEIYKELIIFRDLVRSWQKATLLPIDQLILTIAQDLFADSSELALSHKLSILLGQARKYHPEWRLPDFYRELSTIAKNERKFLGFSEEDIGFDPEKYKGKVIVSTMHKAKGLEWDRVYLMSVNNYDFPSALPHDTFISEKWFIRDNLNVTAETLAQLRALYSDSITEYKEGEETKKSRLACASERLRLLYVGITRAKKELIITWNSGPKFDQQAAAPLVALNSFTAGQKNI